MGIVVGTAVVADGADVAAAAVVELAIDDVAVGLMVGHVVVGAAAVVAFGVGHAVAACCHAVGPIWHALVYDADVFVNDDDADVVENVDDDLSFQPFALVVPHAVELNVDDDAFHLPSPVGEALDYSVLIFLNIYLDTSSLILWLLYACVVETNQGVKCKIYECIMLVIVVVFLMFLHSCITSKYVSTYVCTYVCTHVH